MTAKTYGQLAHGRLSGGAGPVWGIRAVPHVAQMAKRVFPRASATTPGIITMTDTPAVARDIEWFTGRYPLEADPQVLAHLAERADEHRCTEQAVTDILAGYLPQHDWREPAIAPRSYQLEADAIVHATGRLLLADEVGLGKTFTALLRLRDPEALPALVVAPVHLATQWLRELNRFLPWLTGHIVRTGQPYDVSARRGMRGRQPDVLIISYSKLRGWSDHLAGAVQTVIFDEAHELRTGPGTEKWAAAVQVREKAAYAIELSATPVHGYGGEIWNVATVVDRDALGTESEFKREWCGGPSGMGRHNVVRDPAMLGTYLRDTGLMLRRTRKQLHRELPDPIQIEQRIDTDHAHIDQVAGDLIQQALILSGKVDADFRARGAAALDMDWRMRQATGVAKAPYVAEFVRLLLASEDRVVLWGWHRDVYDIWLDMLGGYDPVMYTGSETPRHKDAAARAFMGGDARVLLMSLRSGAGLDGLQEHCSTGVFGELDWSPEAHGQCIGRLNRDGQPATVAIHYLTSDDGTDPLMVEVLGLKRAQAVPIRDPDAPLFQALTPATDRSRELAAAVLSRIAKGQRR